MPNITTSRVRDYLNDLDRALRDLPRDRRHEIVADIRSHIDSALADIPMPSPAAVDQILDHLGTPDTIAAAAFAEMPPTKTRIALRDVTTIVLLLIGGLVLPVIGWLIGAVMLWTSSAWRVKDKAIATLLLPGGMLAPVFLFPFVWGLAAATVSTPCVLSAVPVPVPVQSPLPIPQGVGHAMAVNACTGGSSGSNMLLILLLVLGVSGPLFSTFWLIRHARRLA
jgi:hypothetical protein